MSSYGSLRVGSLVVSKLRNGVGNELLAVFRDDMLTVSRVSAAQYFSIENGYAETESEDDEPVRVVEFRAPGCAVADRLDVIGVDPVRVLAYLDEQLEESSPIMFDPRFLTGLNAEVRAEIDRDKALRASLNGQKWIEMLAASPEDPSGIERRSPGSRFWLLSQIDYWDERYALRVVLLAFPNAEVVLDVTDINEDGHSKDFELGTLASDATVAISGTARMHAPVVVLTEGKTDTEFLAVALGIIYPHLTDLIRFLDYERKPEGGVSALVRMVRAFAAAGIVNRVVAVFDNDTAASDALRTIDQAALPAQIQIIRYPTLELAKEFPTLGPPTLDSPTGSVSLADVNGLAGSIELYLGRDVLTRADETLYPVQWRSFIAGTGQYQGEVVDKGRIQEAFRVKYALALQRPKIIEQQDWSGLRLILDAICFAARSAIGS